LNVRDPGTVPRFCVPPDNYAFAFVINTVIAPYGT